MQDDNLCVLLDDGGLLLISNQDNDEDRVSFSAEIVYVIVSTSYQVFLVAKSG